MKFINVSVIEIFINTYLHTYITMEDKILKNKTKLKQTIQKLMDDFEAENNVCVSEIRIITLNGLDDNSNDKAISIINRIVLQG